jgi:hypothetical protein
MRNVVHNTNELDHKRIERLFHVRCGVYLYRNLCFATSQLVLRHVVLPNDGRIRLSIALQNSSLALPLAETHVNVL